MKLSITLGNQQIEYTLNLSKKAKNLRITIKPGGLLALTLPHKASLTYAHKFMQEKQEWIIEKLAKARLVDNKELKGTTSEYIKNKPAAKKLALQKVETFNAKYNFSYNKIRIKNTNGRWGSCSKDGNLNFHYKIVFLEDELADYLVVHELCHLKELNHSQDFWALVEKTIPNYKTLRKKLRNLS